MRQIEIHSNEAGQRLDKFLGKYLNKAPKSFLYKMLRKKNITRNGKKADGAELLATGDQIRFFLADDTIEKFREEVPEIRAGGMLDIIYEDADILVINKPVGMLSQKAKEGDVSLVEEVMAYTLASGRLTDGQLRTYKPAVCNRLDRNTSGIVIADVSLYLSLIHI